MSLFSFRLLSKICLKIEYVLFFSIVRHTEWSWSEGFDKERSISVHQDWSESNFNCSPVQLLYYLHLQMFEKEMRVRKTTKHSPKERSEKKNSSGDFFPNSLSLSFEASPLGRMHNLTFDIDFSRKSSHYRGVSQLWMRFLSTLVSSSPRLFFLSRLKSSEILHLAKLKTSLGMRRSSSVKWLRPTTYEKIVITTKKGIWLVVSSVVLTGLVKKQMCMFWAWKWICNKSTK